ncbi:MAG: EAL domain-containing protein, partial [Bacteroidales bacterium]|nr:EAL domain-containing protein [Bacteroidales bacterium]
ARWIDPEKGLLPPAEFIPVLEEASMLYKLDLYVVDQILEKVKLQQRMPFFFVQWRRSCENEWQQKQRKFDGQVGDSIGEVAGIKQSGYMHRVWEQTCPKNTVAAHPLPFPTEITFGQPIGRKQNQSDAH